MKLSIYSGILRKPTVDNVFLYYLLSVCYSSWFLEAVWFFYWGRFASYSVIGIAFTLFTVIAIIAEIPTGMLADRYGRRSAVIAGNICLVITMVLTFSAVNFGMLVIGGIIESIGRAFISGALEALVYDDRGDGNRSDFTTIQSKKSQLEAGAFGLAVIIGGISYMYWFRFPYLLMLGTALIATVLSFGLREQRQKNSDRTKNGFVRSGLAGFSELFSPGVRHFIPLMLVFFILYFLFDWGFAKPVIAVRAGFSTGGMGVMYAFFAVLAIGLLRFLPTLRYRLGDRRGMAALGVMMSAGYVLSSMFRGAWSTVAYGMIDIPCHIGNPWISSLVNDRIKPDSRATTLSTLQFIGKIPSLILNILIGSAIDRGAVTRPLQLLGIISFLTISGLHVLQSTRKTGRLPRAASR